MIEKGSETRPQRPCDHCMSFGRRGLFYLPLLLRHDGAIYDRDGNALLDTVEGKRKYSDDVNVRCATMHIVGDKKSNVATSIQKVYADRLVGFNIITGMFSTKVAGNIIHTTLDSDVCAAAYEQMKGKKGAVCVYNYKTGEVICLVSTPTYDPERRRLTAFPIFTASNSTAKRP